jgi:hypothetical protein
MLRHGWLGFVVLAILFGAAATPQAESCCPAPPSGKPVVNADQTVIIIWDAATKTQHFIRKASFKSEADDFGFVIPSPSKPDLAEADNGAFAVMQKLTEPEFVRKKRPAGGVGCGCATSRPFALEESAGHIRVVEEKKVAGFQATVLEAKTATALTGWLRDNGYAFSPEVEAWAQPYVGGGWMFTALKVAKLPDGRNDPNVTAKALRMSFKTDRPLFPYREPESTKDAKSLGVSNRLLRIYFIADARYDGMLTKEQPWTGTTAWAGTIGAESRKQILGLLSLPENTGPNNWHLTEFEDIWPYKLAPADVYFSRSNSQADVRREPIIEYVSRAKAPDAGLFLIAAALVLSPLLTRARRHWR